jgi:hypothetical protein
MYKDVIQRFRMNRPLNGHTFIAGQNAYFAPVPMPTNCYALAGLFGDVIFLPSPRAMPWAIVFKPFGLVVGQ